MRTILAGNWKMHTDRAGAVALAQGVAREGRPDRVEVIVAPPFPYLEAVVAACQATDVMVAAQNCHAAPQGAYTGEVSVPMLKDLGVGACIVGHSERRQHFNETDAAVAAKLEALHGAGLQAIYCCGEGQAERETGRHFDVVGAQLKEALGKLDRAVVRGLVVAYEPVWAIGTGLNATAEQAQEMHAFIRKELGTLIGDAAQEMPILYGGSCKPSNAEELFQGPDVNGGLIGGASLEAGSFLELIAIAARVKA